MQHSDGDRQTSIELLRIVSMLMIVFHHFAVHGGFDWEGSTITVPRLWWGLILMGGKVGVNVFVLISGYFLVASESTVVNIRRLFKFWGQLFFYSMGLFVVFVLLHTQDCSIKTLIRSLTPITSTTWWFASAYFMLYLIHPFLNLFLRSLNKRAYQSLLVMMILVCSVPSAFLPTAFPCTQGGSLSWFVVLYAIAGYARLYGFNKRLTSKSYFLLFLGSSVLTYLSYVVFTTMGIRWGVFATHASHFYGMEKISTLMMSVSLFMAFVTMKMNCHRWVNVIASTTFGIYLIHDHALSRPLLWHDVFGNSQYQDSLFLIPYSIVVVIVVYVSCAAIDLVRQKVFERPYMVLVDGFWGRVSKPLSLALEWGKRMVFG